MDNSFEDSGNPPVSVSAASFSEFDDFTEWSYVAIVYT